MNRNAVKSVAVKLGKVMVVEAAFVFFVAAAAYRRAIAEVTP